MSSIMPFSFNAVELCVVIINKKPWTCAKEVCRALEYGKATKAADVVRHICSKKNYPHKWQLTGFISETKPVDWRKDSQKYDVYTNEEEMCELVLGANNQKQKHLESISAMCCLLVFDSSLVISHMR